MTTRQLQDLIEKMSTDEKLAQITQLNPVCFGFPYITPLTGPDPGLRIDRNLASSIGSVLNCDNASDAAAMQKAHLQEDPHSIPLLFMADIIHGFKTIFPIPLAMGCSFSPSNIEEASRIAALESSVSGIHVTFSPMGDLVRDPRWGRVMESFGEDPLLNSMLCAASVRGYQGADVRQPYHIASCIKHFAAYGAPEGGREYNTVDMSRGILHETYLPAYRSALQAGAEMVMAAFHVFDRVPASASPYLLSRILRDEWDFQGAVISDFNSVGELIAHGVARDGKEAAEKAISAGLDIEMMSTHYMENLNISLQEGTITEQMLDDAVLRILSLKNKLGLFEHPYKDASPEAEKKYHLCPEHRAAARRIAGESIVLLKNEGILPLDTNSLLGLTGPFSRSPHVLGGWSAGNTEGVSLYEGLCGKIPSSRIKINEWGEAGSALEENSDIDVIPEDLIASFRDCPIVIAAVGENQIDTGEGASKTVLRLSPHQEQLLQVLSEAGKKVIAVIFSGRPLEIFPVLPYCAAVIQAWFPGTEAGNALADILFGDVNPSARLSMSFPYTVGQIPVYYNHFNTGRPRVPSAPPTRYISAYLDCPEKPLYPFGYGLSYSDFIYSDMKLTQGEGGTGSDSKGLTASITVTNASPVDGIETVQLYIRDMHASVVRPVKELKDFCRIFIPGGEARQISFRITKETLSFYQTDSFLFDPGYFEIMIGKNSEDTLSETIYIDETFIGKQEKEMP